MRRIVVATLAALAIVATDVEAQQQAPAADTAGVVVLGLGDVTVEITPQNVTVFEGAESQCFTASISDPNGNPLSGTVSWFSSDPTVFNILGNGCGTVEGPGVAEIIATVETINGPLTPPGGSNPDPEPELQALLFADDFEGGQTPNDEHTLGAGWIGSAGGGCMKSFPQDLLGKAHSGSGAQRNFSESAYHEPLRDDGRLYGGGNCESRFSFEYPGSPWEDRPDFAGVPGEVGVSVEWQWLLPADLQFAGDGYANRSLENNKFMALWQSAGGPNGGYGDGIMSWINEFHPVLWEENADSSEAMIRMTGVVMEPSGGDDRIERQTMRVRRIIGDDRPIVPGEWAEVRFCARTGGPGEGFYRLWVNGVVVAMVENKHLGPRDGRAPYFSRGYVLGAQNGGYVNDTEIFVDDFKLTSDPHRCDGPVHANVSTWGGQPIDWDAVQLAPGLDLSAFGR